MNSVSYKAFISYSHQDEPWAKWLHKALETYKVPRRLVGMQGRSGEVAAKLYPVFRDRDELSSAADLSGKVQEALKDSESLVVICSPASAKSRWVNEEIRLFRSLGRGDRIFCVIVDGDPQASKLDEACFPPALLEGGVGETHEPLAADARKWADGKLLAKLKLIAGILGIRLDDLRRREQKRKRLIHAIYAVAALAAVALVSMTIISQVKEKARREHSQTLVSQIVEISKNLNSVVDLETLRTIGERLQGYLDTIDPEDLTPESNQQTALVLRQLGSVSKAQGRLEEAMQAYSQSRTIFSRLSADFPDDLEFLYELGNAEFYVASIYVEKLEYELAEKAFLNYQDVATQLMDAEPENPAWIMEMSYTYTNLAALAERSEVHQVEKALSYMESAVLLVEEALELEPQNIQYKTQYIGTLSWYADAQMQVCDLGGAWNSRRKNEALARELKSGSPANNELKKEHAFALTGLAMIQRQIGSPRLASQSLREAKEILDQLVRLDPSNVKYQWESLRRAAYISDLDSDLGKPDSAVDEMKEINDGFRSILQLTNEESLRRRSQYAQFLLNYSDAAERSGDTEFASKLLDEAISNLEIALIESPKDRSSLERINLASFQWWQLHGSAPNPVISEFSIEIPDNGVQARGCQEANLFARQAILKENRLLAAEYTSYLLGKGYFDPDFALFCKRYGLCDK